MLIQNFALFIISLATVADLSSSLVKDLHYGIDGGLDIECAPDELILIENERLAYSRRSGGGSGGGKGANGKSRRGGSAGECQPEPMCSVPYSQASWYCRGRSSCYGMPVERRPLHKRTCGSDFTNCLRVEYQCVKNSALTNICRNTMYETTSGHLVSPRFPNMYPPMRNCTCSLTASGDSRMRIGTAVLLVKANDPCRDWLSLTMDSSNHEMRRCGFLPHAEHVTGHKAVVNFRSDKYEQEMGFWMYFRSTDPKQKITVRCGKYMDEETTTTTTTTTTSTTTTLTSQSTTAAASDNSSTLTELLITAATSPQTTTENPAVNTTTSDLLSRYQSKYRGFQETDNTTETGFSSQNNSHRVLIDEIVMHPTADVDDKVTVSWPQRGVRHSQIADAFSANYSSSTAVEDGSVNKTEDELIPRVRTPRHRVSTTWKIIDKDDNDGDLEQHVEKSVSTESFGDVKNFSNEDDILGKYTLESPVSSSEVTSRDSAWKSGYDVPVSVTEYASTGEDGKVLVSENDEKKLGGGEHSVMWKDLAESTKVMLQSALHSPAHTVVDNTTSDADVTSTTLMSTVTHVAADNFIHSPRSITDPRETMFLSHESTNSQVINTTVEFLPKNSTQSTAELPAILTLKPENETMPKIPKENDILSNDIVGYFGSPDTQNIANILSEENSEANQNNLESFASSVSSNISSVRNPFYSKVGHDPPKWMSSEPVQFVQEPFEPVPGLTAGAVHRSNALESVESGHKTSDNVAAPEAKEISDGQQENMEKLDLSSMLSPEELKWLLTSEKTQQSPEVHVRSTVAGASGTKSLFVADIELQPVEVLSSNLTHADNVSTADSLSLKDEEFHSTTASTELQIVTDHMAIQPTQEYQPTFNPQPPDDVISHDDVISRDGAPAEWVEYQPPEEADWSNGNQQIKQNVQQSTMSSLGNEQPRIESLTDEKDVSEGAETEEAVQTQEHLISPALAAPTAEEQLDHRSYRRNDAADLYNHVDIRPIEHDLDKDFTPSTNLHIPLKEGRMSSSDDDEMSFQGSSSSSNNNNNNNNAEYFVDRLQPLVMGVLKPLGEDVLQEHDNLVESMDAESRDSLTSAEPLQGLTPSTVIQHDSGVDVTSRMEGGSFRSHDVRQLESLEPSISLPNGSPYFTDRLLSNVPQLSPAHAAYVKDNGVGSNNNVPVSGQSVTWAIIVVGIVGWLVFVAMLGAVIYYRRKHRLDRMYTSRTPSSIYSDFHLPAIPSIFAAPTSPGSASSRESVTSTSYESVGDVTDLSRHNPTVDNKSSSVSATTGDLTGSGNSNRKENRRRRDVMAGGDVSTGWKLHDGRKPEVTGKQIGTTSHTEKPEVNNAKTDAAAETSGTSAANSETKTATPGGKMEKLKRDENTESRGIPTPPPPLPVNTFPARSKTTTPATTSSRKQTESKEIADVTVGKHQHPGSSSAVESRDITTGNTTGSKHKSS